MTLGAGTKLGPYEILAPLGAGGMGEVYRARDTKLNRNVALKVLPEAFASDAARMARFEREAQVLASLNHSNIAAIYGLEESGGVRALVMELVEGPTLAELLENRNSKIENRKSGSSLPTRFEFRFSNFDPLDIAKQIAEALEYAHERGIVHRDLKPANIKVTAEGGVKILDFGLAKALDTAVAADSDHQSRGDAPSAPLQNSPTLSIAATQAGVILGTAAYMSPEQAKGKSVDRRTDIWAFGCVLYEMLTGKTAFDGETATDMMAAVVMKEPDWALLPANTPRAVRNLIRRCLQKDAKRRLQAIGEARIVIEETLGGDTEGGIVPPLEPGGAALARTRTQRLVMVCAAATTLVLAVVAAHFLWRSPAPASWTGVMLGGPKVSVFPRLSPDGRLLAFVAEAPDDVMQLWVMQPESGNRVMLTHSRARGLATSCSWSPDGSRIYYDRWYDQPKGVFAVPALGGDEQLVLEDAMSPEALPDGSLLLVRLNPESRYQVFRYWPETGQSQAQPVAVAFGPGASYIRVIPGGYHALVIGTKVGPGAETATHLYDLDVASGNVRQLPEEFPGEFGSYVVTAGASRDGKYALVSTLRGNTYRVAAVPLDGHGPRQTLLNLIQPIYSVDSGPDGSIYLDQNDRESELVRFSAAGGRVERIAALANPNESDDFTVLPDGRAVWAERAADHARLILVEPGKDPSPLVKSTEETAGPMTAVGSDQVAFMIGPHPHHTIALAALSNGRITRRLSLDAGEVISMAASPDGKTLYCVASGAVWSVPLSGGEPRKLRTGDSVAVDASTQSLVIQVREPPKSRLIRIPLSGGPEREIAGQFDLGYTIGPDSIRNGKLVAPLGAPTWYWPPGIFDLTSGKSARIPLDYINDFHHMAWTPDGRIMAVVEGWTGTIWRFTPQRN